MDGRVDWPDYEIHLARTVGFRCDDYPTTRDHRIHFTPHRRGLSFPIHELGWPRAVSYTHLDVYKRQGAEKSLRTAEELARKQLGNDARISVAVTDGGIYRGVVIGETADYVVQQISKTSAIAHPKELLEGEARAGQKLSITYSNSHALVREVRERSKTQAMER